MPLTEMVIKNLKPADKAQRLFDGGGLYLEVAPSGGKLWRLKYRVDGREKRLSLGIYPTTTLKEARVKREEAKKLLSNGIDPGAAKKAEKESATGTFEAIAREWLEKYSSSWSAGHSDKILHRLERDVFPWLGQRPIGQITPPELLAVLRRVEARGVIETAHRALANCSQIFRYAIATGRAERDISQDLRGAIPPVKKKHLASITNPELIGPMLQAFDAYDGFFVTKCALRFAPLVFVRPGELRKAEWCEFNFKIAEWRIPAERMKMGIEHIVPLSRQALEILEELRPLTGNGRYLFPGARTKVRPMSDATVLNALRRLGYSKEEMTGHGFRSMASTILNGQGWNRDWIERQLAHSESNSVRTAYNYAEYLPERRKMMQAWADYLDSLKRGEYLSESEPDHDEDINEETNARDVEKAASATNYPRNKFELAPLSEADGGGWRITFPDLPGCISDGDSPEEAIKNGAEAERAWLASTKKWSQPKSKKSVRY